MSHTARAFSKATFPVVVPAAYLDGLASCMQTATKNTIVTLILLFYPLFGKDNIFCIIP